MTSAGSLQWWDTALLKVVLSVNALATGHTLLSSHRLVRCPLLGSCGMCEKEAHSGHEALLRCNTSTLTSSLKILGGCRSRSRPLMPASTVAAGTLTGGMHSPAALQQTPSS